MTDKSERIYKQLNLHEHILQRPNIYIGSIENESINHYTYEDGKIVKKNFIYNQGLIKIISEIIENSTDESVRSQSCNIIKVNINKDTGKISVYNNGEDGIAIKIHDKEKKMYLPEFLFSELLTSSNYVDEQTDSLIGINGIGAKATNIFSILFEVEIVDKSRGLKYIQIFENNMKIKSKPKITRFLDPGKISSYTKITFIPDYRKFNLENLTDDIINLIHKKVIDISLCSKPELRVYFNDEIINVKTVNDYIDLYLPNILSSNKVIATLNSNWKIGLIYTPNSDFQQISFVNNAITIDGGTHVNYILNSVVKYLTEIIKNKIKNANVRASYVSDNITLFVIANLKNPTFDSQSKTRLKTRITTSHVTIPQLVLQQIEKTGIVQYIMDLIQIRKQMDLKKTDGKKSRKVDVDKYIPANKAGTAQSSKCRLIITEGDSAKTFAMHGRQIIGFDYYGIYPIRGKMLNVRDVSADKVIANKEISDIKTILGIKHGRKYNSENIKELNYGGMLILTDQDLDGYHIKGLVINFIHTFWRELLQVEGFFQTIQTPIIKVKRNIKNPKPNDAITFYSMNAYNDWSKKIGGDINKWTVKYYKGLGTSDENEAKECFKDFNKKILNFKWEDIKINSISSSELQNGSNDTSNISKEDIIISTETDSSDIIKRPKRIRKKQQIIDNPTISDQAILLAFSKYHVNDRKRWLEKYDRNIVTTFDNQEIPFSDFINKELIHFSNYDNIRSIPSLCDGLKPSQRKALYTALTRDNKFKEIKVVDLSSKARVKTQYLHGPESMEGTIVKMAQTFVGSNNINLLCPKGNFGTRRQGGEDAAATRYINTCLEKITLFIFRQEDNVILHYLEEEGQQVEPSVYYPIIPICLVNGAHGIGTGFSTDIPMFNPIDIIDNLIFMLDNKDEQKKELIPWYRGFNGEIIRKDDVTYISKGIYEIINKRNENKIYIKELPIEIWTDNYYKVMKEKEYIKDYENNSDPNSVKIIFSFEQGSIQQFVKDDNIEEKLKITTQIKLTNMTLYNEKGVIEKYNTIDDILISFYNVRLLKYKERKDKYLKILNNQLNILKYKIKFIRDYISKQIIIEKRKKAEIMKQLEILKYPKLSADINALDSTASLVSNNTDIEDNKENGKISYKSYSYITEMKLFNLTEEKIKELEKQIEDKEYETNKYTNTSIYDLWKSELIQLREYYIKWIK